MIVEDDMIIAANLYPRVQVTTAHFIHHAVYGSDPAFQNVNDPVGDNNKNHHSDRQQRRNGNQ